ncbi:helix-turn-helix transcriptional regulator [Aeromicrobium wangtongii]|uniref:LuxR C-terminal-related transcriptional regulator n=1 Tax=Aeromicrobium wangtongii TaxID=2969247 RepID=A0ABY5MF63_9ACTN|nr:LuxR C-terminal-related transcriptional regulator [Aeromicrobium wangtongii]MCD9197909.1 LuxR C-terminal-related transcriptional regulator [Aeromicrobium wangtongii]UUP15387.1 LuxR C-terminal-related transcriptional regulator [Aeromicrobium wangtongii]
MEERTMHQAHTPAGRVESLLPERLQRLRQASGLPVVFGGTVRDCGRRRELTIGRLMGTYGHSLSQLIVPEGHGLGGAVLASRKLELVRDYASADTITHQFDPTVVGIEQLTSILAVPIVIEGTVEAVIYGAVRDGHSISDRSIRAAQAVASLLERDAQSGPQPAAPRGQRDLQKALSELADILQTTTDPTLHRRLSRVYDSLATVQHPKTQARTAVLSARELQTLQLVSTGATNVMIAAELGLGPETIKSYVRSAMQKLNAGSRGAAVHAARSAGLLVDQRDSPIWGCLDVTQHSKL